jgi:glyoxylase-like metal-dependent hydrolase (beta-lactamase superfamily II)/rhodanese-related sulfurtransferase
MENVRKLHAATLRDWLDTGKKVTVLDIRPTAERMEWYIPGSIHVDAYEKLKQNNRNTLQDINLDKKVPVVTVCAGGRMSMVAADILQNQGFDTYSLEGGMKAWSLAWNKASLSFEDFEIVQIRRTGKGCLSYVLVADKKAIVIDASLPVEIYDEILKEYNWQLSSLLETHIHADHLSRSKQLSDKYSVPLLLPFPSEVMYDHQKLDNHQQLHLGGISIHVITTPGHTLDSACYLINNQVLFSGDTLFTNAVGRPDLKASIDEAKQKAEHLYNSLQMLITLNDDIIVLSAHTNSPTNFDGKPIISTIGEIKKSLGILKLPKTEFIETILSKLPPTPPNHLIIAERNQSGDFSGINPIDLEAGANRCAVS